MIALNPEIIIPHHAKSTINGAISVMHELMKIDGKISMFNLRRVMFFA